MPGNASADLDAYGANLALTATDPNAWILCRCGAGDGKAGTGTHHSIFKQGNVVPRGDVVAAQVEERVASELAGAVEGDVAAARGGVEGCEVIAAEEGLLGGGDVVCLFGFRESSGGGGRGEVATADGVGRVAGEGDDGWVRLGDGRRAAGSGTEGVLIDEVPLDEGFLKERGVDVACKTW
jgi:hypothetical protein